MKYVFLDYGNTIKVYRLWYPTDHKVIVKLDVMFNEKAMQMKQVQQTIEIVLVEIEASDHVNEAYDKHEEKQVHNDNS